MDAKRFLGHHGLALDTARGLAAEELGGGIVGFRLPEEGAGEADALANAPAVGRRRKVS